MSDEFSPETENELRASFFEEVLKDLAGKTDSFLLTIEPLGDEMGYRVTMCLTDDDQVMPISKASHTSALAAGSMSIARGLTAIDDALIVETEDSEMDN